VDEVTKFGWKVHEYDSKVFFGPKMDERRNTMLHQILSDCHLNTFLRSKNKDWSETIH